MKNFITSLLLIIMLAAFSLFIHEIGKQKEVLQIITPTKFGIDIDKNKIISHDEIICIEDIESFSLEPSVEFYDKYSKLFNLSKIDMVSLGYLAHEFAQLTMQNQQVTLKFTPKVTSECRYAQIKLKNVDYRMYLENSGFGIKNNKIMNLEKFKENIAASKKLNLVILNHKSNKYHKPDCEYGKIAHDTVVIPKKQLPKDAKPCKFCHNNEIKKVKKFKYKKDKTIVNIPIVKEPKLTISEGDITFYYTNFTKHLKPDKQCSTQECRAFIQLVNNSKETIDIAIYGYEEVPLITQALQNAKNRGVNIRFVYDEHYNPSKTYYKGNDIIKNLASVSKSDKTNSATTSNMLMHNKFIIFDHNTVFTGSMNFSSSGLSGYDENDIIIIKSKAIADLYEKEFEQMLSGKFHNQKVKHNSSNKFQISNSTVEIYFSPQDKSSQRIVELIKNAKNYIYIPTFLITHTNISNELIKAKKRGIDVRIIMDANNVYTRNTKHTILRTNGIPLKVENYAGKMHSKTMIIDDTYTIMGSMNFSNSGENKNDENMLVIKNSKIAKTYKEFFLYLWKIIPDKYLKYNPKAESTESIGSCSDGVDNNFNGKIDFADEFCKP